MNGVIVLSRLDSSRLPGKALIKIHGKTLIEWCLESLKNESSYKIIIATTDREIDDPIVRIAQSNNVEYFRGDKDNVAKRVLDCARHYKLSAFARINGDSPFIRKDLILEAFNMIENSNYDFVTNLVPRHFPYGLSVEVFKTDVFEETLLKIDDDQHKEHVTTYFYQNIERFKPYLITYADGKTNDQHIRLVVDTKEDLSIIEKMLEIIGNDIQTITIQDLVTVFNNFKI